LRRIQQSLGVTADGMLGPETLSALESRLGISPSPRAFSLEVSRRSLDLLVGFEVTSATVYQQKYRRPVWPSESSGVTIGIGYDLGMTPRAQIQRDWQGWINDVDLQRLLSAQGVKGTPAQPLARSLADVQISFEVAASVFYQATLPYVAARTRATYPGVQKLPADAQGMLLSLIYNRGTSLAGNRRTEMAAIKTLVAGGAENLALIADEFLGMMRLWLPPSGLLARRRKESALIRSAAHFYETEELVRL